MTKKDIQNKIRALSDSVFKVVVCDLNVTSKFFEGYKALKNDLGIFLQSEFERRNLEKPEPEMAYNISVDTKKSAFEYLKLKDWNELAESYR